MTTSPDGTAPMDDAVRDQRPAGVPTCYRHRDRETYLRCHRCERSICTDCMISAAVGFQCPECVRGGAKTGACQGDSGGPVTAADGAVLAVTAWIDGACGGLTQAVRLGPQRAWIDATLGRWGRGARWTE